ncbi:4-hydroxyproline epimerase [Emcibacter nanhaiensis]|uniref:4-hydroxyproline epimerase n=1 Tax=Emcibacter nanhaiensis TaxID=1505037 RepID=A0A501PNP1_9PROT|nr:4-hydroxyproline epimerase [Emcibacter nanhaiensis]TPD61737.1 4-hydroxyproline epimerase [Emcibacter nanhaiensis]
MPETPHVFFCIDGHTCGNPVRLVAGGAPLLRGKTLADKRVEFIEQHDWIRQSLMFEPRGHDMMSGGFFYPPSDPEADMGILFMETSGCLPMCGHGTIGMVTMGLENGLLHPCEEGRLTLETPAGLVQAEYVREGERVTEVRLYNIDSFLYAEGVEVDCPKLGPLKVDISYGGNFYAIIDPQENYPGLEHFTATQLVGLSPELRRLLQEKITPVHPLDDRIRGVSHLMWTGTPQTKGADGRNAVFYGDKAIDRSPCGTGTSARLAQLAAKGKLKPGDDYVHESIIGSCFRGRVEHATKVGDFDAIRPSFAGWARQTGLNTITVDEDDPFWRGFRVV